MTRKLFLLVGLAMLIGLMGCGTIRVEGQASSLPSQTLPSQVIPIEDDASREASALSAGIGLSEIATGLGLLVAVSLLASLVIGATFVVQDRKPAADYPPLPDPAEEKNAAARLLSFKPNVVSVMISIVASAGLAALAGILLVILLVAGLLLGRSVLTTENELALTHPSAIMIGGDGSSIRLIPENETCWIRSLSDASNLLQCEVPFEGATLAVNVELADRTFWSCDADYNGQSIPCHASFEMPSTETYVVIQSRLGLSEERFGQLVKETANAGWGEQDWIWLARGIVAILSLCALLWLWKRSSGHNDERFIATVLRVVYSLGIGLIIYGTGYYVSLVVLLAFNLTD